MTRAHLVAMAAELNLKPAFILSLAKSMHAKLGPALQQAIAEIERQASINEDIIRWLTIKVDELEKGPSVMMRKQERRGGRGRDRDGEE